MSVIVVRLHPEKPTSGIKFTDYLEGLTVEVRDRSFADPDAKKPGALLGTAFYDPADPNSTIYQHNDPGPPGPGPVATAAVQVPAPGAGEYLSRDLRLVVTRTVNGETTPVSAKNFNFNVELAPGSLPNPPTASSYAALDPVAAYVALPAPLVGLPPGTTFLDVPADGTPPPFDAVLKAMQTVVAQDPGPGNPPDLAALTPAQSRHLAREIVYNRILEPLPEPSKPLEYLYRDAGADETARRQFEADLVTYYAVHSTRAEVLAKYVYGVSAALACEQKAKAATQVALTVPVFPGLALPSGGVPTVTVVVSQ
ncbi:hypothetical protein ACIBSW_18875 [Actinoplanes sp. NPDC049668]|uniref:hypothetical protein n=1 Tax=unclassified Actinoplanes TaxID=2626549 RepID=UPI0033BAD376